MYVARTKDGSSQIFLRAESQIDEYLNNGCDIYQVDGDDDEGTLIATPEDGYIQKKPTLTETGTATIGNSELEEAAKILLGMEE